MARTPPNLRAQDNAEEREEKKWRSVGRKRKTKGAVINRVGRVGETVCSVSAFLLLVGQPELNTTASIVR